MNAPSPSFLARPFPFDVDGIDTIFVVGFLKFYQLNRFLGCNSSVRTEWTMRRVRSAIVECRRCIRVSKDPTPAARFVLSSHLPHDSPQSIPFYPTWAPSIRRDRFVFRVPLPFPFSSHGCPEASPACPLTRRLLRASMPFYVRKVLSGSPHVIDQ